MSTSPSVENFSHQEKIVDAFKVKKSISIESEIEDRIQFLVDIARDAHKSGFVLGVSGGQDSFVAGMLAKEAAERLGGIFIAMRLPYGTQKDEADAQAALDIIKPHQIITYNIKPEVDAMSSEYQKATGNILSDFLKGNDKARARMLAQYRIAGAHNLLVIGTDHAAEALTGFYTKFGDGACDLAPLSTLNKRQGRAIAKYLGAPDCVLTKAPTADLLDNAPLQSDEDELGLTYDHIDDFLEGISIEEEVALKIIDQYYRTTHKRNGIPGI